MSGGGQTTADSARRRALINSCGLTGRWLLATFETAERDKHNRAVLAMIRSWARWVRGWAESPNPVWAGGPAGKPGVLMYGPPGAGKSWIGACAVNMLVDNGVAARFLRTVDMPKHDTEAVEALADIERTPVLVLDDLGAEKRTERALECLYLVIDGRAHAEAPTIVTTNWRPDPLMGLLNAAGAGFGDKLLSRLHGLCEFVPVGGPDRRKL